MKQILILGNATELTLGGGTENIEQIIYIDKEMAFVLPSDVYKIIEIEGEYRD